MGTTGLGFLSLVQPPCQSVSSSGDLRDCPQALAVLGHSPQCPPPATPHTLRPQRCLRQGTLPFCGCGAFWASDRGLIQEGPASSLVAESHHCMFSSRSKLGREICHNIMSFKRPTNSTLWNQTKIVQITTRRKHLRAMQTVIQPRLSPEENSGWKDRWGQPVSPPGPRDTRPPTSLPVPAAHSLAPARRDQAGLCPALVQPVSLAPEQPGFCVL